MKQPYAWWKNTRIRRLADRVFNLAWTHAQVLLRQVNAPEADAQLYGRLASSIIYANASLRVDPGVILKNRRGQSGLWGYAISGDLPIVLLKIENLKILNSCANWFKPMHIGI